MSDEKKEVLVVASKVKRLIKENGNLNTAGSTIEKLSEAIEKLCLRAVENAQSDNRKTVMDRDINIDHL